MRDPAVFILGRFLLRKHGIRLFRFRRFAAASQAGFTFPRVAIEGLHYAKTGVIEQE